MEQFSSIKLDRLIETWRIHTYGTCKMNNIAIIKVTKIIIRYRAVTLTDPFSVKLCLRNLVFSFLLQATNIGDLNWNDNCNIQSNRGLACKYIEDDSA